MNNNGHEPHEHDHEHDHDHDHEEGMENINFSLTPELWEEMSDLEGLAIESVVIWDSSLVDENLEEPVTDENRVYIDFEVYLENHTLLELYGAAILLDEESDPVVGLDAIADALSMLADEGATVLEIFADQDENMVLVLGSEEGGSLIVPVSAWSESEWEALPEEV